MSRLWIAATALAGLWLAPTQVLAQCETIRFQHYDGAGMVVADDPAFSNGEGFGIVVDGLPPEHFPLEVTRVGFGVVNASVLVDVEVYDTWPLPQFFPVPTYVHAGVTATAGTNDVDVTPSGPMVLNAQPFTVVARNRQGGSLLGALHDGNGCAGGTDTSIWHYVFVPPGWFSYCPTGAGDWVFWIEYRPAPVGAPVCPGDGSLVDCPCGTAQNGPPGAGCLHSFGSGGVMQAWGKAQVSDDTLALHVSDLPANTIALYFQYATLAAPAPFGDGLTCVGGPVVRLNGTITQNGASCVGPTSQPVSVLGQIPPAGGARYYQAWYRNANAAWCTPARFNLTSGLRIDWAP